MDGETENLADYVKNSENVAEITVTMYNDEHSCVTFRRQFNRQNRSTFYINGQTVSKEEYCAQINALNIQVENLCHMSYLPEHRELHW